MRARTLTEYPKEEMLAQAYVLKRCIFILHGDETVGLDFEIRHDPTIPPGRAAQCAWPPASTKYSFPSLRSTISVGADTGSSFGRSPSPRRKQPPFQSNPAVPRPLTPSFRSPFHSPSSPITRTAYNIPLPPPPGLQQFHFVY